MKLTEENAKYAIVRWALNYGGVVSLHWSPKEAIKICSQYHNGVELVAMNERSLMEIVEFCKENLEQCSGKNYNIYREISCQGVPVYNDLPLYRPGMFFATACRRG